MDELEYYFGLPKDQLKELTIKCEKDIDEMKHLIEHADEETKQSYYQLLNTYDLLKMVLSADDGACLSTLKLKHHGTLDINKVYHNLQTPFTFSMNSK